MNLDYKDGSVSYSPIFLETLLEFSRYLAMRKHTLPEVISHITYRIFSDLHPTGSTFTAIEGGKSLLIKSHAGVVPINDAEGGKSFSVLDGNQVSRCFRSNLPIWEGLDFQTDFITGLPLEKTNVAHMEHHGTSISVPLELRGSTSGVFTLFINSKSKKIAEVELFIAAIAQIFYLYSVENHSEGTSSEAPESGTTKKIESLTQRQLLILELMADGKTNATISNALGYSESTVRQETIKIFFKLGCRNREEASNIFFQSSLPQPSGA